MRFGKMPIEVLSNPDLNNCAKVVYTALSIHHNKKTGQCTPTLSTLATCSNLHKSQVSRGLKDLAAAGLITPDRPRRSTAYELEPEKPRSPKKKGAAFKQDKLVIALAALLEKGGVKPRDLELMLDGKGDTPSDRAPAAPDEGDRASNTYQEDVVTRFSDAQRTEAVNALNAWTNALPHAIEPKRDLVAVLSLLFEREVPPQELVSIAEFLAQSDEKKFWSTPSALLGKTRAGTPVLGLVRQRLEMEQEKKEKEEKEKKAWSVAGSLKEALGEDF